METLSLLSAASADLSQDSSTPEELLELQKAFQENKAALGTTASSPKRSSCRALCLGPSIPILCRQEMQDTHRKKGKTQAWRNKKPLSPSNKKCLSSPPGKGIQRTAQQIQGWLIPPPPDVFKERSVFKLCQPVKADLPKKKKKKKGNQGRSNSTEKLPQNSKGSGMWILEQQQGTLGVGKGRRNSNSHP